MHGMKVLNHSSVKVITTLTILLALLNLLALTYYSANEIRWSRLFSVCCYFSVLWLFRGYKEKTIVFVFILLILADIFNLYYEHIILSKLISIVKISAYFLLVKSVFTKLKLFKNIKPILVVFIGVIVALNLGLAFQTIWNTSDKMNDILDVILFCAYGISIVGSAIVAMQYNLRYHTKRSMYFVYFVFGIILSDVSWFIGYFLELFFAFYADILFYLIGLYCIVRYSVETSKTDDVLLFED